MNHPSCPRRALACVSFSVMAGAPLGVMPHVVPGSLLHLPHLGFGESFSFPKKHPMWPILEKEMELIFHPKKASSLMEFFRLPIPRKSPLSLASGLRKGIYQHCLTSRLFISYYFFFRLLVLIPGAASFSSKKTPLIAPQSSGLSTNRWFLYAFREFSPLRELAFLAQASPFRFFFHSILFSDSPSFT